MIRRVGKKRALSYGPGLLQCSCNYVLYIHTYVFMYVGTYIFTDFFIFYIHERLTYILVCKPFN